MAVACAVSEHVPAPTKFTTVPATVQTILAARIDRLSPDDKTLLQTAAVIGKDVPFALLQAITEIPEETLRFFGLAGTPADCADGLRGLLRAFPAIAQVAIVPAPSRGATAGDVVRRFAAEVVPHLVSSPAGVEAAPAA